MSSRQTILVIDDSLFMCRQIENALKNDEVDVFLAHTARQALVMAESCEPDLILLDIVLPDMEGYELLERLKEQKNDQAPVLFITSKDSEEDVIRGFSQGACDYIKKPFRPEELRSRVMAHLEIKRQRDELRRLNDEMRANVERLNSIVYRDELTGLCNRRYVMERLLAKLKGSQGQSVIVMLDVDDFKQINDTYGHDAGDMVLVSVSGIMEEACSSHYAVRWGGEEFLIILIGVTGEEAWETCEAIRCEIASQPFVYNGASFTCTVTLGLASYQRDKSLTYNVNCADLALYYGKRHGKNHSVWYDGLKEKDFVVK